jgi:hypothetical protein
VDLLFSMFDPDHSGEIDYTELKKMLTLQGGEALVAGGAVVCRWNISVCGAFLFQEPSPVPS